MLFRRLALVILGCLFAVVAGAQTLTVSAAASLTDVFRDIGQRFEAAHPGVSVRFNFAASGVLIQQIAQGAPADVFVSADEETIARGMREKLLDPDSRRDIASNVLVLIVPGSVTSPTTLADLAGAGVKRVAVGKLATVPVGRYAKQALEAAGIWSVVEGKAVYAESVRQVLDYVARGEVDAGFVYRTDAAIMPDKVRVAQEVGGHDPVRYPAAVVADSGQKTLAREFLAYVLAPEAQAMLAKRGFSKP